MTCASRSCPHVGHCHGCPEGQTQTQELPSIPDPRPARVDPSPAITDQLEAFIDALGLATTLETLATVCSEKAEHVRANWQDETLAKAWERMARRCSKAGDWACKVGL